jgi:hypothetical protein
MSKPNSSFKIPDPFIMTPNDVNQIIADYLNKKEFTITIGSHISEVDIRAVKGNYELFIESRGNQAYKNKGTDKIFDSSQIDIHLSEQITQIMRFQQSISTDKEAIFIMANPYIHRIVKRVEKHSKALDKLEIVRLWVDADHNLSIQCPEELCDKIGNIFHPHKS